MSGTGLLTIMNDGPTEVEGEFGEWCREQYMPAMLGVPGVLSAYIFRAIDGRPRYLSLFEASSPEVFEKAECRRVRGWGPAAEGRARDMFSDLSNLTVGVYTHMISVPDPEPDDLSGAGGLMVRGMEDIDPAHYDEFQDWYSTEHVPALVSTPGALRGRRYRLWTGAGENHGDPLPYLALYDAETVEVFASEGWVARADTPWTRRLRRYFKSPLRNVYQPVH